MVKKQTSHYVWQVIWGVVIALTSLLLAWIILLPMLFVGYDNQYMQIPSALIYFGVITWISAMIMRKLNSNHPYLHGFITIAAGTLFAAYFVNPDKKSFALVWILFIAFSMPWVIKLIPKISVPRRFIKLASKKRKHNNYLPTFKRFITTGQNWVLLVFIGIPILYAGSYVMQQLNTKQDSTRFYQLQRDMKDLHVNVTKLDQTARYGEYCRSDMGIYTSEIPRECGFSISIDGVKHSREFETVIEESPYFSIGDFTYKSESELKGQPRWLTARIEHDRISGEECTYTMYIRDDELGLRCTIPAMAFYLARPDQR